MKTKLYKKSQGITLIELIVVLVVFIMIIAIIGSSYTCSLGAVLLKTSSARIVSLLKNGQDYAREMGYPCRLCYDVEQGTYWMEIKKPRADKKDVYTKLNNFWGTLEYLPRRASFKKVYNFSQTDKDNKNFKYTTFFPDGSMDICWIFLENNDGDIYTILTFKTAGVKVFNCAPPGFKE